MTASDSAKIVWKRLPTHPTRLGSLNGPPAIRLDHAQNRRADEFASPEWIVATPRSGSESGHTASQQTGARTTDLPNRDEPRLDSILTPNHLAETTDLASNGITHLEDGSPSWTRFELSSNCLRVSNCPREPESDESIADRASGRKPSNIWTPRRGRVSN